jgi:prepilin-type N-terminal cleavage/methylation domain-containing protein
MRFNAQKQQTGYSLLELLGVVAILAIVAALAVPNLTRANRQYALQSTAQQIAQIFETAKTDAIKNAAKHRITFNLATNTIVSSNGSVVELPSGIRFDSLPSNMGAPSMIHVASLNGISLPQQQSDDHVAVSFPVGSSANVREVYFSGRGLPDVEPGIVNWIYLVNQDGKRVAVTLSSVGSVAILNWRDNQWK